LGERRTVTVLFADASGFTSLSERLDEEQVYSLMQGCLGQMMEAVHHYEGTITQFLGDGVMALFGAPIAHEDSARRAVAAALEMQISLVKYVSEVKQPTPIKFQFRVGLNTGPVVVGRISDNLDMDYTALGDTVNLAARMQQVAEPGSVYLSESTYHIVHRYFELQPLETLEVKGKAEPVVAYRVVREKPVGTRFEAAAERGLTPFIGRDQELAMLKGYLKRAKRGQGQVVFISGVAGIGKSRLLHEFRRSSLSKGVTLIEGNCISYGRVIPYLPIIDVIKHNFAVEEGDNDARIIRRVDEGTADWEKSAQATVPYLKFLLNVDPGDPTVAVMDPMERKAGILDSLRALLLQESRHQPLLVIVEDLHWIDKNSAEALTALVDMIGSLPVLMVLSYRPSFTHSLGERSYYNRLALGHLARGESEFLAEGMLQVPSLPQQVKQLITSKAEGNPFFIEEVTKSLLESGILSKTNGTYSVGRPIEEVRIPDTIQEIILSRIDRLEQKAKEALQLASVIGREFTVQLLDRISDMEAHVDETLDELKLLELIYQKDYFPELSYMFKHALTHDVAYNTLLLERRKVLHCFIGAAIEDLYADRLSEHYEALAHHYYEGEDWAKALDYQVQSGDKAAASYANQDALDYYAQALEVCAKLGAPALETAASVAQKRGFLNTTIGEFQGAAADFNQMQVTARSLGDRRLEGMGLAARLIPEFWNHTPELSEKTFRAAMAVADEGFDDVRLFASLWFANSLFCYGHIEEAQTLLQTVEDLVDKIDDPISQGTWSYLGTMKHSQFGRFDEALAHREHWRSVVEKGPLMDLMFNKWVEALAHGGKGEYQEAIALLKENLDTSERIGEVMSRARVLNSMGWVLVEIQNHKLAMKWHERAVKAALEIDTLDPEIEYNAILNLADTLIALNRLDEAEVHFKKVEQTVRNPRPQDRFALWAYSGHFFHSYGELWLARGNIDKALAYADECVQLSESTGRQKNIVKGRRLQAQAFLAQGKLAEAEREISTALKLAKKIGNPPQLWKTHAALGDLRQAQGQVDARRKAYRDALAVIDGVAASLTDKSLRKTFLISDHVQGIRKAAEV
jgi:class 3 adenylate cyclase/tetratricopeptide (TPR) repeat protein